MPIIAGFPASNMISPSVRITEQDLSYYGTSITSSNAGIVGFASKGPINTPKLITSKNQLNQTFGYPHPDVGDPYLIYAAEQYLQRRTTQHKVINILLKLVFFLVVKHM